MKLHFSYCKWHPIDRQLRYRPVIMNQWKLVYCFYENIADLGLYYIILTWTVCDVRGIYALTPSFAYS